MDISPELVEQFARGNGVLFVGAGLSIGAGLPGWGELLRRLAAEIRECSTDVSYPDLALYYEIQFGRNRLVTRLRNELDTFNVRPTSVHESLARIHTDIIFTTNYDDLLEQAMDHARRRYERVIGTADASFWSSDRLQLVKLHGDLSRPDSIVITAEDYERYFADQPALVRLLAVALQTRTILLLGYSASDPDFRQLLTSVRGEANTFARNAFIVLFNADEWTVKGLERRGMHVINLEVGSKPGESEAVRRELFNQSLTDWLNEFHRMIQTEVKLFSDERLLIEDRIPVEELSQEVSFWLRALGYTILQEQRLDDRMLDITAELPEGVRFLVRCIDGEVHLRRVQELARRCEEQNFPIGWIIAERRVSPSAIEYAAGSGILRVFNLASLMRHIFGFYFDHLTRLITESDIHRYYVDLSCEKPLFDEEGNEVARDVYPVIDAYIDNWLSERGRNHISILGEFGSGKTWFCLHYAYSQLQKYLDDPTNQRLPLLINLREYSHSGDMSQLVTDLLVNRYKTRIIGSYELFEQLNRSGRLLLILDGFDEMETHIDYKTTMANLKALATTVVAQSKVLLTCRTPSVPI